MAAEACRLAPALIDTVYGVIAVNRLVQGVCLDIPLSLVAVGLQEDVHLLVLLWRDAEDGSMAAACHLQQQMFVGQANGIIMGMGYLTVVAEATGPALCCSYAPLVAAECRERERAVVLRAAAHYPVAVAEALKQRVGIIIRCHALLLRIAGLRCPEILAVGRENGRQRLSVLFRAFSKKACRTGVGRCCAHHRIQGAELAQVLYVVHALTDPRLQFCPRQEADRLLVVQQLDDDLPLGVAVEHHLQIGCHWQYLVHQVIPPSSFLLTLSSKIDTHQREQPVEIRIVAEAQVGPRATTGDGGIGVGLDTLPK